MTIDTRHLKEHNRFKLSRIRSYFGLRSPESRPDTQDFHAIVLLQSPVSGSRSEEQEEKIRERKRANMNRCY